MKQPSTPSSSVDCSAVTHKVDRFAVEREVDRSAVTHKTADRGVYPDKIGAVAQEVDRCAAAHEPDRLTVALEDNSSRCQHRTPAGRRCRRSVFDPLSGLCRQHALTHQKQLNDADFAAALTGRLAEFTSASDIHQVLANLFVLLAQNRISARRAAVLAYITSQLLRTLSAMDAEANAAQDAPLQIINDMPRPDRAQKPPVRS